MMINQNIFLQLHLLSHKPKDFLFNISMTFLRQDSSPVFDLSTMLMEFYSKDDDIRELVGFCIDYLLMAVYSYRSHSLKQLEDENLVIFGPTQLIAALLNSDWDFRCKANSFVGSNKATMSSSLLSLLNAWRDHVSVGSKESSFLIKPPKWVCSCFLSLANLFELQYIPFRENQLSEEEEDKSSDPMQVSLKAITKMLPPFTETVTNEMVEAADLSIDVIDFCLKWAEDGWEKPPRDLELKKAFAIECPVSATSASLELLQAVSKCRKAAKMIISKQGHVKILSIPNDLTGLDNNEMVRAICRHLIEEDGILLHSMEEAIAVGMSKPTPARLRGEGWTVGTFFAKFAPQAWRHPMIFMNAIKNKTKWSQHGKTWLVSLKGDDETQEDQHKAEASSGQVDTANLGDLVNNAGSLSRPITPPPKKAGKKVSHAIMEVMDAIIGRLIALSSIEPCEAGAKRGSMTVDSEINQRDQDERKLELGEFSVSQQVLHLTILSEFVTIFPQCITAFLRRDADPVPEWTLHGGQVLGTPVSKKLVKERSSTKKTKEAKSSHKGQGEEKLTICYLIRFLIRNQIAAAEETLSLMQRSLLTKAACEFLHNLSLRSVEGRKRVVQEIHLILHAWAYPRGKHVENLKDVRNIERADRKKVSADLEGAIVLLYMLLSLQSKSRRNQRPPKASVETITDVFLKNNIVRTLVDVLPSIDLNRIYDHRLKGILTCLVKSIEKLTSKSATAHGQIANDIEASLDELLQQIPARCEFLVFFYAMSGMSSSCDFLCLVGQFDRNTPSTSDQGEEEDDDLAIMEVDSDIDDEEDSEIDSETMDEGSSDVRSSEFYTSGTEEWDGSSEDEDEEMDMEIEGTENVLRESDNDSDDPFYVGPPDDDDDSDDPFYAGPPDVNDIEEDNPGPLPCV